MGNETSRDRFAEAMARFAPTEALCVLVLYVIIVPCDGWGFCRGRRMETGGDNLLLKYST